MRSTPAGQSVATFSIATNRVWKDKTGQKREDTEFHNIVVWGRQAEIGSQYITKGMLLLVEGRLQTRGWTDKNGQSRKVTEIICDSFQLGPRPQGQQGGGANYSRPAAASTASSATASPAEAATQEIPEEIPIINVDEEGVTAEDLPF